MDNTMSNTLDTHAHDDLTRLQEAQLEKTWGATQVSKGEIVETELGGGPVSTYLKEVGLSAYTSHMGQRSGHFNIEENSSSGVYLRPVICIYDDEGAYEESFSFNDKEIEHLAGLIRSIQPPSAIAKSTKGMSL